MFSPWIRSVLPSVRTPVLSLHAAALVMLVRSTDAYSSVPWTRVAYMAICGCWYEAVHGGLAAALIAWLSGIAGSCAHASDNVLSAGHGLLLAQIGSCVLNFRAMHRVQMVSTIVAILGVVSVVGGGGGGALRTASPCATGFCVSLIVSERLDSDMWYTSMCSAVGACLVVIINMSLLASVPEWHYLAAAPFTAVCLVQALMDVCEFSWRECVWLKLNGDVPFANVGRLRVVVKKKKNAEAARTVVVSV